MISQRRAGLAALLLGVFTAFFLHGRLAGPPVYDGIVVPPAPYRFESPPPNLRNGNQKPLGGSQTYPVAPNGDLPGGGVQTDDNQVITFWGVGTFKAPGATTATCSIQPVANPPAPPAGNQLRGNVYRISCTASPATVKVAASTYHLTMRLPPGTTNDIRYYNGSSWRTLVTLFAPGGDPYASVDAPGFGEYAAMARNGASTTNSPLSDLSRYLEFYGILAFVVLFAIIAVVQEVRRRRHRQPPPVKKR